MMKVCLNRFKWTNKGHGHFYCDECSAMGKEKDLTKECKNLGVDPDAEEDDDEWYYDNPWGLSKEAMEEIFKQAGGG
jgi:hypothetical protein